MKTIKTDVCVVGAGAGGFGCVYRLLKNGINTEHVIEQASSTIIELLDDAE